MCTRWEASAKIKKVLSLGGPENVIAASVDGTESDSNPADRTRV